MCYRNVLLPLPTWWKVLATYHRVDDLVTCGVTACTLGSCPGPTLGNEHGKSLPLFF